MIVLCFLFTVFALYFGPLTVPEIIPTLIYLSTRGHVCFCMRVGVGICMYTCLSVCVFICFLFFICLFVSSGKIIHFLS